MVFPNNDTDRELRGIFNELWDSYLQFVDSQKNRKLRGFTVSNLVFFFEYIKTI